MNGRAGFVASGVVLMAAGIAALLRCRAQHHLEDGALIAGIGLLAAWLVQRPHPAGRFLATGLVLTGVGGAVVLLRVTGETGYETPAILGGAALALLLLAEVRGADVRRGVVALGAVALYLAALVAMRSDIPVDVRQAASDGTLVGWALLAYGALVVGAVVLPGRPAR